MDLVKIGKYIAGKRKDLGMTQKQLAEKLGMSDKSVSKGSGACVCRMYPSIRNSARSSVSASMNSWHLPGRRRYCPGKYCQKIGRKYYRAGNGQ